MSQGPRTDNCGSPFWLPPEMILDKPHTLGNSLLFLVLPSLFSLTYPYLHDDCLVRLHSSLAVDIWSFGITLIEAANGSPPNRAAALKAVWDVALSPSPSIDGMACDGKPWSAEMKVRFVYSGCLLDLGVPRKGPR